MKKLLGWAALAMTALWAINDPAKAAAFVHHVGHALATLASSL